jgi:uncharacterized protein YcbX
MHVAQLWRYPVKSFAGERLEGVEVAADGIPGDRGLFVRDGRGEAVTGRTRPALLGLRATLGEAGEALVDGRRWEDEQVAAAVHEAAGDGARLARAERGHRFDDTPLLVATDGAIAALGQDGRRLRPNVVIAGVEGLAERGWPGRRLRLGEAEIAVSHVCVRCVMTTIDPDTLEQDPGVLRRINERFEGRIALNCTVARPGRIVVGDPVELL